ncbi:MAG: phosphoenolpyruvate synthase [Methanomassiliicoccus sp.]|nr:phosphoenolpyruvate synthase [Methanomassiliicoccus sp.]
MMREAGKQERTAGRGSEHIRWFSDIRMEDVPIVGGKNASLGEMYRELTSKGVRIPNGFAVTADGYRHMLSATGIRDRLGSTLEGVSKEDLPDLAARGKRARDLILGAGIPDDLWIEIREAYDRLCDEYGENTDVAVRSSATAEDLPNASFAGQQETYLNVRGHPALREACAKCFASLFTDRAISYRIDQGFGQFDVALSIGVMKMVRSDLASSGVMFTLDTETGFRDVVFVTASYGLGENIVQGAVDPDEYYVFKPTLRNGHEPIIKKEVGGKEKKLIYGHGGTKDMTRNVEVPQEDRERFCLTDREVLDLARYAMTIEDYYSAKFGHEMPMDIEWAKDGVSGELFIVQSRPETVQSQKPQDVLETYMLEEQGEVLVRGHSVGTKIASGKARVITDISQLPSFRPGEILISDSTTPDWEPVMKIAAAIVTNLGGRTSHAAIVSRELGIPAVVGTDNATRKLHDGDAITVSCAEGDDGFVYRGALPFRVERTSLADLRRPRTEMMMNLGNPDEAFSRSFIPNDGVGLARLEFIIGSYIRVHPMALLHPDRVEEEERKEIDRLTSAYADKPMYFVEKLAQGIATIAAAFYPKEVVVRMSDLKTNEYASLLGGRAFEPVENNPMLGFRGASRYYSDRYREGFGLECKAIKIVRERMGLTNVVPMVPFCRTIDEARKVVEEMKGRGLERGVDGLKLFIMCEVPNNVLLIDRFSEHFDGFSIGSNDLTQLVLGIDRDSEILAEEFDERDPGVLMAMAMAVKGAKSNGRHSGICGQAPSDYPEIAEFLVREGIDSISVDPETLMKITLKVLKMEDRLKDGT